MMDIAKIQSPSAQTVQVGTANIILSELLFEDPDGVVDANPSGSSISVAQAGHYLVTYEAYVVGTGDQFLYLAGNGFTAGLTDFLNFNGDALGISHGRAVVVQASAGANIGLQAINSGAGAVTYLCALGVALLAKL
jgi:hypothetical protein